MWSPLLPWVCLLLGAARISGGRIVYPPLDPLPAVSNSLYSIYPSRQEEWRPLDEEGGRSASETSEVFASAPPPSILGSLSVFGHATVHARQPARRLPARPREPPRRAERPRLPYQDAYSVRPRDPHPHSSALSPNSFFFETPQPFQSEPPRRAVYKHNPYRLPTASHLYPAGNEHFPRPLTGLPFEPEHSKPSKPLSFFPRNPFGDIRLGPRRPEPHRNIPEPPAQQVYDQYAHLGRPFQAGSFVPSTGPLSHDPFAPAPLVTTYSSPKFPEEPTPSARPDYVVTRQPYDDDLLPITVTTIDVPQDAALATGKPVKEPFFEDLTPTKSHWEYTPKKPATYKPYEEQFLPTPSSFPISVEEPHEEPLLSEEPTARPEEITDYPTTEVPEVSLKQRFKNRRRPGNKYHEINKDQDDHREYQKGEQKRRRKPGYRGPGSYDRVRNSEYKKRTTTTTEPPYEPTVFTEYTTAYPITEEPVTITQFFTTDPPPAREIEHESEQIYQIPPEEEPINEVIQPVEQLKIEEPEPTSAPTTPPPVAITTTPTPRTEPTTTTTARVKTKYGNRPRFSVKDYRERLNRGSSTTTAPEEMPKKEPTKAPPRLRGSSPYKGLGVAPTSSGQQDTEGEAGRRKYKPRQSVSRYRSTTVAPPSSTESTSTIAPERQNTFRPSTNRFKPGSSKYYSRYRTSTPPTEEESSPPTPRTIVRPKGVFSAKRRPFPLKNRLDIGEDEGPSENEVAPATLIVKKVDAEATTASSEDIPPALSDLSILDPLSDPTGIEAMRIADLTSSPSNEFKTAGFTKSTPSTRRNLPKISFATEEPILPLEAFFQTHSNKDKK